MCMQRNRKPATEVRIAGIQYLELRSGFETQVTCARKNIDSGDNRIDLAYKDHNHGISANQHIFLGANQVASSL